MFNLGKIAQFVKKIRAPGEQPPANTVQVSNNFNNHKSQKKMTAFNYGVGGSEVAVDANEAILDIQENKTLLVSKLTEDDPVSPQIVTGLRTVDDVFKHYQPSVSVTHETEDGTAINEEFHFKNLGDFTPKNLIQKSAFLKDLSVEQEQYNNIIRQLRNNKVLRNMLTDSRSKAAFIEALKGVAAELENNNNHA